MWLGTWKDVVAIGRIRYEACGRKRVVELRLVIGDVGGSWHTRELCVLD